MAKKPRNLDNDHQDVLDQLINDDEDREQLGVVEEDDLEEDPDDLEEEDDPDGDEPDPTTDDVDEEEDEDDDPEEEEDEPEDQPVPDTFQHLDEDQHGNLLYKGKVLVPRGKARSVFDKLRRDHKQAITQGANMARQLQEIAVHTRKLLSDHKTLKEQRQYHESVGLSDQENREAIELYAMGKTDPKGAIRRILTKAHLGGTDLSDLGVSGPLDANEIARAAIAQHEAQQKTTSPVVDEETVRANAEAKAFLDLNPQAMPYVQHIAEAKNQFPQMTLQQIWNEIQKRLSRS